VRGPSLPRSAVLEWWSAHAAMDVYMILAWASLCRSTRARRPNAMPTRPGSTPTSQVRARREGPPSHKHSAACMHTTTQQVHVLLVTDSLMPQSLMS
jgi:hypothetical protein